MKKHTLHLVILTLLLAGLACNLPYQNPAAEVPAIVDPATGFRVESRVSGGDLISLAVPDSFVLGQSGSELSALIGGVDLPVEFDLEGLASGAQTDVLLWGYDAGSAAQVPTSFVVIKNETYAAMPLGLMPTIAGPLVGDNVEILQEQRMTIAGRDTLRWITVTREGGMELTQAVYIFKDSGVLYLVGFNADRQEVGTQLPIYDAIVASLRIEDLE
ncbi:MAG: hypothetical protein ACNA70_09525 [Brevefilum sp.]